MLVQQLVPYIKRALVICTNSLGQQEKKKRGWQERKMNNKEMPTIRNQFDLNLSCSRKTLSQNIVLWIANENTVFWKYVNIDVCVHEKNNKKKATQSKGPQKRVAINEK